MRQFGMGAIYAIPSGANPTPVPIAILKDATVDFKVTKKPLRGQWKFPIDAGEGPVDATVKIKAADFRANVIAMLLAGGTTTTGSIMPIFGEAAAIPGSPYQYTVANGGTFKEDGGILDLNTGLWMARGATATGAGVYAVNTATGQYTFAAADTTHNIVIVYSYTAAAVGKTFTYPNQVMGPSTPYALRVYDVYSMGGVLKPYGWDFPAVHFDNLSFALKAEDWTEIDLSGFAVQDTASTNVFKEYIGE